MRCSSIQRKVVENHASMFYIKYILVWLRIATKSMYGSCCATKKDEAANCVTRVLVASCCNKMIWDDTAKASLVRGSSSRIVWYQLGRADAAAKFSFAKSGADCGRALVTGSSWVSQSICKLELQSLWAFSQLGSRFAACGNLLLVLVLVGVLCLCSLCLWECCAGSCSMWTLTVWAPLESTHSLGNWRSNASTAQRRGQQFRDIHIIPWQENRKIFLAFNGFMQSQIRCLLQKWFTF